MYLKTLLVLAITGAVIPTFAQVAPQANRPGIPLTVGVGYSNYATDWYGRLEGPSLWLDWSFDRGPAPLNGLGIEVEARDLNYGKTTTQQLRMDTISGGPIYTLRHYRRVAPYAKFLLGYGSMDFDVNTPGYTHDTRTVIGPGGGADYRAFGNLWVRGNYDYQFWPDFFHHHALNPNGFTFGAFYDLGGSHTR